MRWRATTVVWGLGVLLLAAGVGLGSRVAQTHVMARKAWLAARDTEAEGYDAAASDALYDAATASLDDAVFLARVLGMGLVLLSGGLVFRVRREKQRGAVVIALGAAALVWGALSFAAASFTDPMFGPIVAGGLHAAAPFCAVSAGLFAWALRARRSAAKVPASGEETT